jgi:hypothetical protein
MGGPVYGTSPSVSEGAAFRRRSSDHDHDDLFVSPESNFADFTYPPYSEMPFTLRQRRKRAEGNQFVKWTMRAVLASPMVVLVLWSGVALLFSGKQQQQQAQPASARRSVRIPVRPQSAAANSNRIPFIPPLGQVVDPNSLPFQGQQKIQHRQAVQTSTMMAPQYIVNPEQYMTQAKSSIYMASQQQQQQNQYAADNNNMVVQPPPAILITPLGAGSTVTTNTEQLPPPPPPLQASKSNVSVRHRPAPRAALTAQSAPEVILEDAPPQNLSGSTEQQIPPPQQVYYYDPNQAVTQGNELMLPSTVYDSAGNPVSIQALQGAQIYLEPPLTLEEVQAQAVQAAAPLQMSVSSKDFSGSSLQDQSIIVATVAVMALLVGALSARRMRSRSFLSSCIENEQLEDEVAYDTAYTTTDASYNTFGGWKGDLEKFDV